MLGPLLLIVLGVLFLLNNVFPDMFRFRKFWPVILIVIGLVKVIEYFQPKEPDDKNLPPGPANPPAPNKEGM